MSDLDNEEIEATREMKSINKIIVPEEKTADEMFEELGYKKVEDTENGIEYRKEIDGDLEIDFWKIDKTISKNFYRDLGYITMQELQAINKKCEELGWL